MTMNDRAFAMMVKQRDGFTCQRCGLEYASNDGRLQAAHCFGRGKPLTRHDLDNAAALDWECHAYLDTHPNAKRAFFRVILGDARFEMLQRRSNGAYERAGRGTNASKGTGSLPAPQGG